MTFLKSPLIEAVAYLIISTSYTLGVLNEEFGQEHHSPTRSAGP